jgi:hypothetical protein
MKNKPNNIHIPYQLERERERERENLLKGGWYLGEPGAA